MFEFLVSLISLAFILIIVFAIGVGVGANKVKKEANSYIKDIMKFITHDKYL